MAHPSELSLLALHGLRLKGFAETEVITALFAGLVGWTNDDVNMHLNAAAERELTDRRDGRMSGWMLKPGGRKEGERLLSAELDASGGRPVVTAAYESFLGLNSGMLELCTRWQVKDPEAAELNDHSDPSYDQAVIGELAEIDEAVRPILADLVGVLDRFSVYSGRFTFAHDILRAGENDWFTKPITESYHTVWFELHEDLLATLGIDRASEGAH